jgi:hypothetical protein
MCKKSKTLAVAKTVYEGPKHHGKQQNIDPPDDPQDQRAKVAVPKYLSNLLGGI